MDYGKILSTWGRGVVANMRPCQGRDRGFEPRRSRQSKETFARGSFDLIEIGGPHRGDCIRTLDPPE